LSLIVIDYSPDYYAQKKLALPSLRQGKFVLIRNANTTTRYTVFAPLEMANYHANIVERFCQAQNIAGRYNNKRDVFEVWDEHWQVVGGGRWRLDTERNTLAIFATSMAYGSLDLPSLAAELSAIQAFNGVRVGVE